MLSAVAHLLPYALLATLSPLGFAATITVLRAGRMRAVAFAVGVVAGQLLTCGILVALGHVASPGRSKAHPTVVGVLELGLALALLAYAFALRRRPEAATGQTTPSGSAVLERLRRVHVATASAAGFLLGIGGPKRLVLTALAAATINVAGLSGVHQSALVLWYGLLATAFVWLPVAAYLLLGARAVAKLDAGLAWLGRNRGPVRFYVLTSIGLVLLVHGAQLL